MTTINIQFHALPAEVAAFAKQCMEDFNLYAVAMRFFPFEAVEVSVDELGSLSDAVPPYRELALTLTKPLLPAKNDSDFKERTPNRLRILLATIESEGLRQIALSAQTDDPNALSIWKKVANRLKKLTHTGVIALNPDTGAMSPARTFRYTPGAKAAASSGVPMLPIAGGNLLIFSGPVQVAGNA